MDCLHWDWIWRPYGLYSTRLERHFSGCISDWLDVYIEMDGWLLLQWCGFFVHRR
jgi:hypothetical protein